MDNGRKVLILADTCWEVNRGLYYKVMVGEKTLIPLTHWGTDDGSAIHSFKPIFAENKNLLGILEGKSDSDVLIIIHDFNTNESWPRLKENEISHNISVKKKWRVYFNKLRRENPNLFEPEFLKK